MPSPLNFRKCNILVQVTHPALDASDFRIHLHFKWEDFFQPHQPLITKPNFRDKIVLPSLLAQLKSFYDSYDVLHQECQALNALISEQALNPNHFPLLTSPSLDPTEPSLLSDAKDLGLQLAAQLSPSNFVAVCDLPITSHADQQLMAIYHRYCTFSKTAYKSFSATTHTVRREVSRLKARVPFKSRATSFKSPRLIKATPEIVLNETARLKARLGQLARNQAVQIDLSVAQHTTSPNVMGTPCPSSSQHASIQIEPSASPSAMLPTPEPLVMLAASDVQQPPLNALLKPIIQCIDDNDNASWDPHKSVVIPEVGEGI